VTDTNVFRLSQPRAFSDPLTEVLRNGARVLLAQAVEAEHFFFPQDHCGSCTDGPACPHPRQLSPATEMRRGVNLA
jgi:hypothetical protein